MGRLRFAVMSHRTLTGLLLAASLLWSSFVTTGEEASRSLPDDSIFTNDVVLQIQIVVPDEGMAILRRYVWNREGSQGERIPVHATVKEGGVVYTNVALHLKGSAGSFRPLDDKPGLTLNFDKFAKGQRFHGFQKISLNNSVQDPSFITDKLCREVFEKAGVPVPKAGYGTVRLNGRSLGLYVMTEGWNKQFLKRYFKNTKGNLYEGGFAKDITSGLITNSGETPEDQSDIKKLTSATRVPDLTNRLVRLEKALDLDRFITLLALDALLWNWDGYALNHNNYRLFHDLDSDRFVFFPHGMDQMFWKPEGPIMPGMKGVVANSVMQIPECRRRYVERVTELMTNECRLESLTNRVVRLAATLRKVQTEPAGWGSAFRRMFRPDSVGDLLQRIEARRQSLDEQLLGLKSMPPIDPVNGLHLTGWQSRDLEGRLIFKETKGKPAALLVSAQAAGSIGAWLTTVWLEGGRYRVTGKVRVQGVKAAGRSPRNGAGFRVFSRRKLTNGLAWDWFPYRESNDVERRGEIPATSSDHPNKRISGTTDWVEVSYDFDLRQPAADLEISCELRADEGEAWFDLASLRIIRQ